MRPTTRTPAASTCPTSRRSRPSSPPGARRDLRHARPPPRRRRARAGQLRRRRDGDLPGGLPDPAVPDRDGRRAQRALPAALRGEHPRPVEEGQRPARADRGALDRSRRGGAPRAATAPRQCWRRRRAAHAVRAAHAGGDRTIPRACSTPRTRSTATGSTTSRCPSRRGAAGGRAALIDFAGTAPQTRGPINCPIASTESAVYYAVTAVLDPGVAPNEGAYRPIGVLAPEGTVLNPASRLLSSGATSSRTASRRW